eukprot:scaffold11715_cov133-Isochrysis_galbana.AAC.1
MAASGDPTLSAVLDLSCPCGKEAGITEDRICQVFICHCSMCPEDTKHGEHAGGAGWAAVPPVRWFDDGASRLKRTSEFAQRRYCSNCDRNLAMRYDCETYTEWVSLGTLPSGAATKVQVSHIHVRPNNPGPFADGAPCYASFEPWTANPDPCRPTHIPAPSICVNCHRHAVCLCKKPA